MRQNELTDDSARTSEPPDPRRWYALALLCTTLFVIILDSSVTVVAIPSIGTDLGMSPSTAQWVISAYAVPFGGLLLFGGRLADMVGRRRVFMYGVALFAGASLACGFAESSGVLIGARMLQGAAAAVMTPSALSIVLTTFPEGPERNKALGFWGATGGIGGTAGALIGGPVTDGLGWPWIFYLNVPVCAVLFALSPSVLHESRNRTDRGSFDVAGATSATAGLMLLVYAVVQAPTNGWVSAGTLIPLAGAAALGLVFWWVENGSSDPLVPLRIFGSRTLIGGNLVIVAIGMAVYGGVAFTLTLYAQHILGYSAWEFGLMSSINAAMAIVGSYVGQRVVTKAGVRPVAEVSLVLAAAACVYFTQIDVDGNYMSDMFLGLLIFGCGLGAGTVAGTIAAVSGVVDRYSGVASGISTAAFQIGGALGIAVVSSAAVWRTGQASAGTEPAYALTDGYQFGFGVCVAITLAGLVVAHRLLRPTVDVENGQPASTHT